MSITSEELKQKAVECMNKLGIDKRHIERFKEGNSIYIYEYSYGIPAYLEPEVLAKVKQFEDECDCLVYAVTYAHMHSGEYYDFLYVPRRKEDWDELVTKEGTLFYAETYRWDVDDDEYSDYATIGICSVEGGIARVI